MATNLPDTDAVAASEKAKRETKGAFARLALFIREVIGELRKVVTPTRSELVNYTLVVLVFVLIMMLIITAFDLVFGWAISWVFGDGSSLF